ncbi:TPR-like protein [Artomyces pyxidatus]|uniref:TPR-like protein n=1 Tax=Artomyces pyxidatus TaxID=48021 RepID=A0ACB8SY02_9AGAM|nr:TPR-like protein [Artomyces pyxidatus]
MSQYAVEFLRAVDAHADVFGPLKSVVGGALYVAETVKKFKSNKSHWDRFAAHIQDCLACVLLPENNRDPDDDRKEHMKVLASTLDDIMAEIETIHEKKGLQRFGAFLKDPEKIARMRQKFDDAICVFQLKHAIASERDITEILKGLNAATIQSMVQDILEKFGNTMVHDIVVANVIRDAFPTPAGATWRPEQACSPGTRVAVLEEIEAWIDSDDPTKKIFLISDVAGSGKSAIAHAICQRRKKHLVSHFFFARGISARDDYGVLLGYIIRDLAVLTKTLGQEIGSIFEQDRTLLVAGPSRQFDDIIMPLCRLYPTDRPILIVIDALDEGHKDGDRAHRELLRILRDQIYGLPGNFRILVTCRPDSRIMPFLENKPHVLQLETTLCGNAAEHDISVYVGFRLEQLREMVLSESLPEDLTTLSHTLIQKSEGLFIWVATIIDFAETFLNPIQQLQRLLAEHIPDMDALYQAILDHCNWADPDFKKGYYLLMGTVLAARSPLTLAAMKALHKNAIPFGNMQKSSLRSLLSGLDANDKPVQILHLSLREFLTLHTSKQYAIMEREHSQRLALMCLDTLNTELSNDIAGLGYSSIDPVKPLPDIGVIADHLLYACRFWTVHIVDLEEQDLTEKFLETFSHFVKNNLVTWMEVVTVKDRFQPLDSVRNWAKASKLSHVKFTPNLADLLNNLSTCLSDVGQVMEALEAIKEAAAMYKTLALDQPVKFTPNLATSLNNLSNCLAYVGQVSEALKVIEEAVTMYRALAVDQPVKFTPDLAMVLDNLSSCLSDVGQVLEALQAIKEAVTIRRKLAVDQPVKFTPNLADSLNNLSNLLSDVGQIVEALEAIREAVTMYKTLAKDQPVKFTPSLATSLNNFSNCLSYAGYVPEALEAIKEAVLYYRALAGNQPTRFTSNLAHSLNNLSNCLSDVGQVSDTLQAIREAVSIYRILATDHPDRYTPDLAMSLDNLSSSLSDVGHSLEALQAIKEAVTIRRRLVVNQPVKFTPGLADSLNNLSNCLLSVGQVVEALEAIKEAVTMYKTLAADQPERFTQDLADSLNNLSNCLSYVGEVSEALQAINEAVAIYRTLAVDQPAKSTSNLATSLNNLSSCLSDVGQVSEGLQAIQEAVTIRRRLAVCQPVKFIPDLADSLNNLSNRLSDVGQVSEALEAIKEAVTLYRTLAVDQPVKFAPNLAMSLNNLSSCLSSVGQVSEALRAIKEAVTIRRKLAVDQPVKFTPDLADSLNNLSNCLSDVGQISEAVEVIKEAVVIYRSLIVDQPAKFTLDLAWSLKDYALYLSAMSSESEALKSIEEAVVLYKDLAADNPERFQKHLDQALRIMSACATVICKDHI